MYPTLTFDKSSERNSDGIGGPLWGYPMPHLLGIICYRPSDDPHPNYPVRSSREPHPSKEPGKTVGPAEVIQLPFSTGTVMLQGSDLVILLEEIIGGKMATISINDASNPYVVQEIHRLTAL